MKNSISILFKKRFVNLSEVIWLLKPAGVNNHHSVHGYCRISSPDLATKLSRAVPVTFKSFCRQLFQKHINRLNVYFLISAHIHRLLSKMPAVYTVSSFVSLLVFLPPGRPWLASKGHCLHVKPYEQSPRCACFGNCSLRSFGFNMTTKEMLCMGEVARSYVLLC